MHTNKGEAVFTMKKHFAAETDAKNEVGNFLQTWEIKIGLENDPGDIAFKYKHSEVIDLAPVEGEVSGRSSVTLSDVAVVSDHVSVHVSRGKIPAPPVNFVKTPDVETMYQRYKAYREGRDSLLSMAYVLLTVAQINSDTRQQAAEKLKIDREVLNKLGDLCSTKGSEQEARKAPKNGEFVPLTPSEKQWIDKACKLLIERCGELGSQDNRNLNQITMDSLPELY